MQAAGRRKCECGCERQFEVTRVNRRFFSTACRRQAFRFRWFRKHPRQRIQEARPAVATAGLVERGIPVLSVPGMLAAMAKRNPAFLGRLARSLAGKPLNAETAEIAEGIKAVNLGDLSGLGVEKQVHA